MLQTHLNAKFVQVWLFQKVQKLIIEYCCKSPMFRNLLEIFTYVQLLKEEALKNKPVT